MSEALFGEKCYIYGKHRSEETRKKMSESRLGEKCCMYGKHHSEETKIKMSESQIGNKNHNYGKHHTEESKTKCRATWELKRQIKEKNKELLNLKLVEQPTLPS